MMKKQLFAGAAALAFVGTAAATHPAPPPDPVANTLAGLDGAAVNLDNTLDSLVVGNSSGTADGLTSLVTDLSTMLATDTAGEDLALMGAELGNQLNATGQQFLYPLLDQLTMPGAEPLRPFAQFYLDSGALAQGIPFVRSNGSVTIFEAAGASSLEAFGFPASTFADLIGPGGQLSLLLGQILSGGAADGGGFSFPGLGMDDAGDTGLPGAGILFGFLPGGDSGAASIPGADILLSLLSLGGNDMMATALGPDALLALLPIPGGDTGMDSGIPGADVLLGLLSIGGSNGTGLGPDALLSLLPVAGGESGMEAGIPGADILLGLLSIGGNGTGLGPDALLTLLPISGGESGMGAGIPGADVLLGLLSIGGDANASGNASANGGLPGLDTLLVLIPVSEDGSPLGMLPLGPDALLALLDGLSLPGMNGA